MVADPGESPPGEKGGFGQIWGFGDAMRSKALRDNGPKSLQEGGVGSNLGCVMVGDPGGGPPAAPGVTFCLGHYTKYPKEVR